MNYRPALDPNCIKLKGHAKLEEKGEDFLSIHIMQSTIWAEIVLENSPLEVLQLLPLPPGGSVVFLYINIFIARFPPPTSQG